jgi:hypothetical protein
MARDILHIEPRMHPFQVDGDREFHRLAPLRAGLAA